MGRPLSDPENRPVPITTTIPYNQYMLCKKNGWTWREVFSSGMGIKVNDSDAPRRIRELEIQVERLKEFMKKRGYIKI